MALPGESGEGESYTVSLSSVEETEALGGLLASLSKRGDVIFLHGELGAGKTALSRGFLRYFFLNSELDVPSPTYLLHFVYQQDAPTEAKMITEETVTDGGEGAEVDTATTSVSVSSTKQATSVDSASQKEEKKIVFKASRFAHIPDCAVHHLDPYRLAVGKIAALVDFETMFRDEISLIEWPERLGKEIAVPAERLLHVHLSGVGVQAENRKAKIVFGSTTSDTFGEQQVLNVKSATSKTSSTLEDQHSSASTTPVSCTWSPRLANLIDAERDGQKQNTDAKERSLSEALERFRTKEAAWIFGEGELTPETSASSALNDSNAFTTTRAAEHLRGQHQKEGEKKSKMKSATSLPSSLLDESGKRLQRPLVVLGIESSCDDTGCAIVTSDGRILGECVASQAGIHEAWGGVKPDAAQKAHRDAIHETVETCIERAKAACGVQHQTTSSEKDASTSSSASTPSNEKDTSSSSVKTAPEFSSLADIDAVAVTVGPGLGLCLSVGVEKAVTLATELQKPLVRIHHMEAHAMMTRMPLKKDVEIPDFPYLTLLVSGGHNMVVLTEGLGQHRILGSTLDDSVGEAFDKTSRLLGITQIPGGPHLERLAKQGNDKAYPLAKPLCNSRDVNLKTGCDFSYSGLKTGVKALIERLGLVAPASSEVVDETSKQAEEKNEKMRADVAAVFQRVAVAHLVERTDRAVVRAGEYLKSKDVSEEPQREPVEGSSSKIVIDDDKTSSAAAAAAVPTPAVKTLVVAGGVAANGLVRAELTKLAEQRGLNILIPPPKYCVDNGVMVAWTGVERLLAGLWEAPPKHLENAKFFFETRPRWPLGERDGKSNNFKERISKEMKQKMLKKGEKVKGGLNINAETTPSSEIDVLNIKGKNTSSTNATMAQTGTSEPLEAETLDQNASSKRPRGAPDGEEELLSKRAQKRLKKAEYIAERKEEERKKKEASASGGGC